MPRRNGTFAHIQFSEAELTVIRTLKVRHGFRSTAEAVRHGLRMAALFDRSRVTVAVAASDPPPARAEELPR